MTQLTYTIAHIKIGAEDYWEEVEGFVSGDKKTLSFATTSYIASTTIFYSLSANRSILFAEEGKSFSNGKGAENTVYNTIQSLETLQRNDNHSLSILANKLGATIYGGFEDEKDFYLMLPTVEGFKVGDYYFDSILSIYAFNKYKMYREENARFGFHILQLSRHNEDGNCSAYEIDFDDVSGLTNKPYKDMKPEIQDLLKKMLLLKSTCQPKIKNIFQKYARTGIIENDLYKEFFK